MIVITIYGMPGSGKSFICSKLPKGVACLDTDDYTTMAYESLVKDKKPVNTQSVWKLSDKMIRKEIKKHDFVVVAGLHFKIKSDHVYFIKIKENDFKKTFDRVIDREINKYKKIDFSKMEKMSPEEKTHFLRYKYHLNAINITWTDLKLYKNYYKESLDHYSKDKTKIMTQENIIKEITKLFNN